MYLINKTVIIKNQFEIKNKNRRKKKKIKKKRNIEKERLKSLLTTTLRSSPTIWEISPTISLNKQSLIS